MPEHSEEASKKKATELTAEEQLLLRAYANFRNLSKVVEQAKPVKVDPPCPKKICIESVAKSLQSQSDKKTVHHQRHRPRKTWGNVSAP